MAAPSEKYVLVTAAYNEEAHIEKLLSTVVSQTLLPVQWIVISDGSIDRTDEIVHRYAQTCEFIQFHRITKEHKRNFAAQVTALNIGFAKLSGVDYEYIGNLDADISLEPTYFERLLKKFQENPNLGLAGGFIYEKSVEGFKSRAFNSSRSVPLALQLFRRACFECLGGYTPLPYGGPDWHAEVTARMNGWEVESFPDLPAFHHRPTGTAFGLLRYWYLQGLMDYSLGCHPFLEIARCSRRLWGKPPILGPMTRLAGFAQAYCRHEQRPVSHQFVNFLREEQKRFFRYSLSKMLRKAPDRT